MVCLLLIIVKGLCISAWSCESSQFYQKAQKNCIFSEVSILHFFIRRATILRLRAFKIRKIFNLDPSPGLANSPHTQFVFLFLGFKCWQVCKGHLGSPGSYHENLVNTIPEVMKLRSSLHVVGKCIMVERRTLLFLVEFKGHMGSPRVKL